MNIKINETDSTKWGKYLNRARMLGLSRDKKWLGRLIDKNCVLAGNDSDLSSNAQRLALKEQLFSMIDVLNSVFKDNWDLHLTNEGTRQTKLHILIHYEQLTIQNESGNSRLLRDLILVLPLNFKKSDMVLRVRNGDGTIMGTRGRLSYQEAKGNYRHSHLPSQNETYLNYNSSFSAYNFCIGGDSDLSTLLIEQELEYDEGTFELLLHSIDHNARWESLAGGPHIRMDTLTASVSDELYYCPEGHGNAMNRHLKDYVLSRGEKLDVDFYISSNRYKIKINSKFENFLKEALLRNMELAVQLLCKRRPDGTYITYQNDTRHLLPNTVYNLQNSAGQLPYIYIAGKKITMRVTHEGNPTTQEIAPEIREYSFHPNMLNYVTSELESKLYKAAVKGSAIRASYTRNHAIRST